MKWLYGFLLIVTLGLGFFVYLFFEADESGRRTIYQTDEQSVSRYPGYGVVGERVNEHIFVNPRDKMVFFDTIENVDKYMGAEYEVIVVPAQEKIDYVVGKVLGWMKIKDSSDEYLVLATKGGWHKYRAVYDQIDSSVLLVEQVNTVMTGAQNTVEVANPGMLSEIGVDSIHKMIRRGDAVVLRPKWDLPSYAKKDENDVNVIDVLIVRRVGGAVEWEQELNRTRGEK